jgi:hypothetical protein
MFMTSWSRLVLVHHLLAFGMLSIWPASSVAQHVPPVAEEMAKTYGLDSFDPAFLNDQYWLLLPLHVAWDGADVTDEGKDETPFGKAPAERIVIKYASGGAAGSKDWIPAL